MEHDSPSQQIPMRIRSSVVPYAIAGILLFAAFFYLKFSYGVLTCDDAYITLSHVKTWTQYGRPVMSLHNPTNACSTPLYAMLLAALSWLMKIVPLEMLTYLINSVLSGIVLLLCARIGRHLGMGWSWIVMSLAAIGFSHGFLLLSASGMETMLYLTIIGMGFCSVLDKRGGSVSGYLSAFLGPLVRPEGLLIPVLIGLALFLKHRQVKQSLPALFLGAAGFSFFVGFYYFSYGELLPHSVIAKRVLFRVPLHEAIQSWINHAFFAGPLIGGRRITALTNLLLLLASVAGYIRARQLRQCALLISWPCLYILFFILTRSSNAHAPWYYYPIVPILILTTARGLQLLLTPTRISALYLPSSLLFCAIVTMSTLRGSIPTKHRFLFEDWPVRLGDIAESIVAHASEGDLIMHGDVGALGYFGQTRILDVQGLISPEVIPFMGAYTGRDLYCALTKAFKPRWVLLPWVPTHPGEPIPEKVTFLEGNYDRWSTVPAVSGCDVMIVWKRGDD